MKKVKITLAEIISVIVLLIVFILVIISTLVDSQIEKQKKSAKDTAYSIAEAGKLAHMSMKNNSTTTFTEASYFDGNTVNRGPFLLTIDKYQNTTMNMWFDNKYCIKKEAASTEFVIDESITNEKNCLVKRNTVSDLLTNYDLIDDTAKTGLDSNNAFASTKYYAGEDPSNYIVFSNACFRILNITSNNYLKIVYEGPVSDTQTCTSSKTSGNVDLLAWDSMGTSNYDAPSSLRNIIEVWNIDYNINNVLQKLEQTKLVTPTWYIGKLKDTNPIALKDLINLERSTISNKDLQIGLLNISDYLKASSNVECQSLKLYDKTTCSLNNYLFKNYNTWFFNTLESSNDSSFMLDKTGTIILNNTKEEGAVRPVLYLSNQVTLTGSGRSSSPYMIH